MWIWRSQLADPQPSTVTFTKKFYVSSDDASDVGLLRIAGDNHFHAELNGDVVADGEEFLTSASVGVPLLHGLNTLVVTIENYSSNQSENPAGALWSIASSPGLSASELYGLLNPLGNYAPCVCGDPVDNATGNFSETVEDLTAGASGTGGVPISATRSYNSLDATHDGSYGHGWTSAHDWSLAEDSTSGVVTLTAGNGATSEFFPDGAGGYGAANRVLAKLTPTSGGGWKLVRRPHSTLTFDSNGRLTSMSRVAGVSTDLTYSGGRLVSVTDATGRSLTYSYGPDGHISTVTGPNSRSVAYTYDLAGDLRSVTDAAGKTTTMTYDDHQMLTLTDPEGGTTVNTYDTEGRVATQKDPAATAGSLPAMTWDYESESDGDSTTTVTDPNGSVHLFRFHNNILKSKTSAFGTPVARTTTYAYDASLQPAAVTDPEGNVTKYAYSAAGDVVKQVDAKDQTSRFTYNSAGDRLTATGPGTEPASSWTYNSDGLPLTATDPKNRTTQWTYTPLGDIDTVTKPRGGVTDHDYTNGNQTKTTSPGGRVTTWTYDPSGWVTSSTDPRGNVAGATPATKETYTGHYTYDAMGRRLTSIDPADTVTTNTYDGNGNLARATIASDTGAGLRTFDYTYTPNNQPKTQAISGRTVTTKSYDPAGHLTATTDGNGDITSYTYDPAGQQASMTTARGTEPGGTAADFTWTYLHDLNGNQTNVIDPQGRDTAVAYDELNRPVTQTTPRGKVTTTTYDPYDRVTSILDPLNRETEFTYTDAGELKTSKAPGLAPVTYAYDLDGNRLSEASPSGYSTTSWTYTPDGQVHTRVDPNGNVAGATAADFTTTYDYDAAGNLTSISDPLAHVTSWTYDPLNQQTSKTFPISSQTITWTYDRLGQLTKVSPPGAAGGDTKYTYDQHGDMVTRQDGEGRTTAYEYNDRHQVTKVTDPLSRQRTFGYDPEGNLTSWVTPRGHVTGATASDWTVNQTFDARGLLTARTTSGTGVNTASSATMSYDDDASMTQVVDGSGTTTLGYDNNARLTSVTQPQGNYGYTYTASGQVASRTYPSSGAISYGYNVDGLQNSLTADGQTTTFVYNANQALTAINHPNAVGLVETRNYDKAGRLSSVRNKKTGASTDLSKFSYTRDPNGNVEQIQTTRGSTVTNEAFNYNSQNWLTKYCPDTATCAASTHPRSYTYSKTGNRLTQQRVGTFKNGSWTATNTTTNYTYDSADQLTKRVDTTIAPRTTNFTYTADGQLSSGGRNWNVLGQMTASNISGSDAASYKYDGLGNRRTVTTSAGTKKESWDINNPMPMLGVVTDTSNHTHAQRYTPTGDILQSQHPSGTYPSSYYGHDAMGSVTDVLKGNGTPAWNYAYEPFGSTTTSNPLVTGAVQTDFGYTGAYKETALDQYALRARDYDTNLGRFGAPDPLAQPINNPYASSYVYVNNQPTVLVDPTGKCGVKAWLETRATAMTDPWGPDECKEEDARKRAEAHTTGEALVAGLSTQVSDMGDGAVAGAADGLTFGLAPTPQAVDCSPAYQAGNAIGLGWAFGLTLVLGPAKLGETRSLGVGAAGRGLASLLSHPAANTASRFGSLTHAADGIAPYSTQQLITAGQRGAIQAHHLIERRFAGVVGQNVADMWSIVVTQGEHQVFTNAWRQAIPRGSRNVTPTMVNDAARNIYRDYPEILQALGLG